MRRPRPFRAALAFAALLAVGAAGATPAAAAADSLRFLRDGKLVRELPKAALRAQCAQRVVVEHDPYYGRRMEYLACPLAKVFELGFGTAPAALGDANVFFLARDGYA